MTMIRDETKASHSLVLVSKKKTFETAHVAYGMCEDACSVGTPAAEALAEAKLWGYLVMRGARFHEASGT